MKLAIFMIIFYNIDLIERTLESIINNNIKINFDIYFLENPSINSNKILELKKKYNVTFHFISNKNLGGCSFEIFITKNKNLLNNYDLIAYTESDVILEKDSVNECIDIIKNNKEVELASIQIDTNLEKYKSIKKIIKKWIPKIFKYKNFYKGHTGGQFIVYKKDLLIKLLDDIKNNKICGPIALGEKNFYHICDTNLQKYCKKNNIIWGITNKKLDHIGWELILDKNKNYTLENYYVKMKKRNIKQKKIRSNKLFENINDIIYKKL